MRKTMSAVITVLIFTIGATACASDSGGDSPSESPSQEPGNNMGYGSYDDCRAAGYGRLDCLFGHG